MNNILIIVGLCIWLLGFLLLSYHVKKLYDYLSQQNQISSEIADAVNTCAKEIIIIKKENKQLDESMAKFVNSVTEVVQTIMDNDPNFWDAGGDGSDKLN